MSESITHVTDETFEAEVLKSDLPVLVDFWAEWCGPCRMLGPTIEALAAENQGRLKVCKADTEACADRAGEFGIASIPTVIFFKDGSEVERLVGMRPKTQYQQIIERLAT